MSKIAGEDDGPLYPHNVLEGFGLGAMLDLRVRFAHDYLMHSPALRGAAADMVSTDKLVEFALSLADELLVQGRAKGWVKDLPETAELNRQVRLQAERTAGFQVLQQIAGQKILRDEENSVIRVQPKLVS